MRDCLLAPHPAPGGGTIGTIGNQVRHHSLRQHLAPQEETAVRRNRIPRGLVEEINAVGKREMETARAMPFLMALTQIADGGDGLAQGIGGF